MHSLLERERAYRRRLLASLGLAVALQLIAWWLLPSPLGRSWSGLPAVHGGIGGGLSLLDVSLPRSGSAAAGSPASVQTPATPPAASISRETSSTPPAEPEIDPVPRPMGPPAPAPRDAAAATGGSGAAGMEGEATGHPAAGDASEAGAAGGSERQILHNQLWVHPQMPERILIEHKIDDFVLLQVLVGADGRVHDVRTLRDIPNCDECNRNAVEAAWRLTFDPPVVPADSTGVWSPIFNYRFSYR